jgi:hypothetical protein
MEKPQEEEEVYEKCSVTSTNCVCYSGMREDLRDNVIFGHLLLNNGEMSYASVWYPSKRNPKPNGGMPYCLKIIYVLAEESTIPNFQRQVSHQAFGDDKFEIIAFKTHHNMLTLQTSSTLAILGRWPKNNEDFKQPEYWIDANGSKIYNEHCHGTKLVFIPNDCCRTRLNSHFTTKKQTRSFESSGDEKNSRAKKRSKVTQPSDL